MRPSHGTHTTREAMVRHLATINSASGHTGRSGGTRQRFSRRFYAGVAHPGWEGQSEGRYLCNHPKVLVLVLVGVMALAVLASGANNKFGVADARMPDLQRQHTNRDALPPRGQYRVRHVMDEENHVMVFQKLEGARWSHHPRRPPTTNKCTCRTRLTSGSCARSCSAAIRPNAVF
jgi:hypothetical protein